jgi:hypothetical protein
LILSDIFQPAFGEVDPEHLEQPLRVAESSIVLLTLLKEGGRHNAEVLFLVLFEAPHELTDMIHAKTCCGAIRYRKRSTIDLGLHAATGTQDQVVRI